MFRVSADADATPINRTRTPTTAPIRAARTGERRARAQDGANWVPRSRMYFLPKGLARVTPPWAPGPFAPLRRVDDLLRPTKGRCQPCGQFGLHEATPRWRVTDARLPRDPLATMEAAPQWPSATPAKRAVNVPSARAVTVRTADRTPPRNDSRTRSRFAKPAPATVSGALCTIRSCAWLRAPAPAGPPSSARRSRAARTLPGRRMRPIMNPPPRAGSKTLRSLKQTQQTVPAPGSTPTLGSRTKGFRDSNAWQQRDAPMPVGNKRPSERFG